MYLLKLVQNKNSNGTLYQSRHCPVSIYYLGVDEQQWQQAPSDGCIKHLQLMFRNEPGKRNGSVSEETDSFFGYLVCSIGPENGSWTWIRPLLEQRSGCSCVRTSLCLVVFGQTAGPGPPAGIEEWEMCLQKQEVVETAEMRRNLPDWSGEVSKHVALNSLTKKYTLI